VKLASVLHRLAQAEREARRQPPVAPKAERSDKRAVMEYATNEELAELSEWLKAQPRDGERRGVLLTGRAAELWQLWAGRMERGEFPPGREDAWRVAIAEGRENRMSPVEAASYRRMLRLADEKFAVEARERAKQEAGREQPVTLRQEGHSYRAIGGALGVNEKTARNDVNKSTAERSAVQQPDRVIGLDGKSYPATEPPAEPALEPAAARAVPAHAESGWREIAEREESLERAWQSKDREVAIADWVF
jgi:hypothetical protein